MDPLPGLLKQFRAFRKSEVDDPAALLQIQSIGSCLVLDQCYAVRIHLIGSQILDLPIDHTHWPEHVFTHLLQSFHLCSEVIEDDQPVFCGFNQVLDCCHLLLVVDATQHPGIKSAGKRRITHKLSTI